MPVPLSALLNSLATARGMPIFLANFGLCAAAAIVRAIFGVELGISASVPRTANVVEFIRTRSGLDGGDSGVRDRP